VDCIVVKSGKIGADFKTFRMKLPIPLSSTFLLSTTTTIPAGAGCVCYLTILSLVKEMLLIAKII
jgi:hypothetical protein